MRGCRRNPYDGSIRRTPSERSMQIDSTANIVTLKTLHNRLTEYHSGEFGVATV
jgi:hypothetical protein